MEKKLLISIFSYPYKIFKGFGLCDKRLALNQRTKFKLVRIESIYRCLFSLNFFKSLVFSCLHNTRVFEKGLKIRNHFEKESK